MLNDRMIYLNGKFVEWDKATVHLMSHSMARGSAIFEVISFHSTDAGPAVFRLDEHIERFFRTAELLSMEVGLTKEEVETIIGLPVQAAMPYLAENLSLANYQNHPYCAKFPADTASIILGETAGQMVEMARQRRLP